jgi:hypothetical protein
MANFSFPNFSRDFCTDVWREYMKSVHLSKQGGETPEISTPKVSVTQHRKAYVIPIGPQETVPQETVPQMPSLHPGWLLPRSPSPRVLAFQGLV